MSEIEVGQTEELSQRVSVAGLARVLFEHPQTGKWMLALERKATLLGNKAGGIVAVKSQPFGGALRLLDPSALQKHIGDFHFDSERSRSEGDFRIFIRPSDWDAVRSFCLGHFGQLENSVLESDPSRELAEEIADSLGIKIGSEQYTVQAVGTILEDDPSPTKYIHAAGFPTTRIYRIFEARILDPSLAAAMIEHHDNVSDHHLHERVMQDARDGGYGKANGVLTLALQETSDFYSEIPFEARNTPIWFRGHQLDETVAAVLDGIAVPKYRRLS